MEESPRTWPLWVIAIVVCVALWSMHDDVKKAQSAADEAESEVSALHAKVEGLLLCVGVGIEERS